MTAAPEASWRLTITMCGASILIPVLIVSWLVAPGVGITPDSLEYLRAARSFVSGNGLVVSLGEDASMLGRFPPLYPLVVAFFGYFVSILDSAKIVAIAAAGLSSFAFFRLLVSCGLDRSSQVAGALFFVFAGPFLGVAVMAWSEACFVCFALVIASLTVSAARCRTSRLTVAISSALACASLTRYVGAVLGFLPLAAIILRVDRRPTLREAASASLFIVPSFVPIVVWKAALAGRDSREFALHPPALEELVTGAETIGRWFVPLHGVTSVLCGTILICGAIAYVLYGRSTATRSVSAIIPLYLTEILIAKTFFDAEIPFNDRILFPMFPVLILTVLMALSALRARFPIGAIASACILAFAVFSNTAEIVRARMSTGFGVLTEDRFPASSMAVVGKIPQGSVVYSNAADFLEVLLERRVESLPSVGNPQTREPSRTIEVESAKLVDDVRSKGAFVVYVRTVSWRRYLLSEESFRNLAPDSDLLFEDSAVAIYGGRAAGSATPAE